MEKNNRIALICLLALCLAIVSVVIAKVLLLLIALVTNLAYFQTFSFVESQPAENKLGFVAVFIPVIGGLIVGLMARFGSKAIRGHGIPEAMENILMKQSRIPKRMAILKPISSAIAIGTGGPFGAEGPIIATGGAIGSLVGQVLPVTELERKILVACGAAAGMTAIFGTPFSALLLSIELLLFEFRARSFLPVAIATAAAGTFRYLFFERKVFFAMPDLTPPTVTQFFTYLVFGVLIGFLAIFVTKIVYWLEDSFENLPIHWMFWPALGGLAVGAIGLIEPRTLGVGYSNITEALSGNMAVSLAASIMILKFLSWSIALSSGTSGGTLAPLMTLGACFGFLFGILVTQLFPGLGIDIHTLALIGMAGIFAGASRAMLASVLFAFEATGQPVGIVPLLACCSLAYIISMIFMKNSIMTEKIARRGINVPHEYYPKP